MKLRIEVKVDDEVVEAWEFLSGGQDSVGRFWNFIRGFQS